MDANGRVWGEKKTGHFTPPLSFIPMALAGLVTASAYLIWGYLHIPTNEQSEPYEQ